MARLIAVAMAAPDIPYLGIGILFKSALVAHYQILMLGSSLKFCSTCYKFSDAILNRLR